MRHEATARAHAGAGPDAVARRDIGTGPGAGSDRLLGVLALVGGCLLGAFWLAYGLGWIEPAAGDGAVAAFESAFPVADALLAIFLIAGGAGVIRGRRSGWFAMIAAAGMTLYLGLLDLTFYAGRGHYTHPDGDTLVTLIANVLCIGGGAWALIRCRRTWRTS